MLFLSVPTTLAKPASTASCLSVDRRITNTRFLMLGAVASSWIPPESVMINLQFFIKTKKSRYPKRRKNQQVLHLLHLSQQVVFLQPFSCSRMHRVNNWQRRFRENLHKRLKNADVINVFCSMSRCQSEGFEGNLLHYGGFLFGNGQMLDYSVDGCVACEVDFAPNILLQKICFCPLCWRKQVLGNVVS